MLTTHMRILLSLYAHGKLSFHLTETEILGIAESKTRNNTDLSAQAPDRGNFDVLLCIKQSHRFNLIRQTKIRPSCCLEIFKS